MSALELISLANQLLFVGLFVVVLWHAIRRRTRAGFDTALLFGSITAVLVGSRVADAIGVREAPIVTSLILAALSLPPYAMLRLVDDFRGTPRWTQVAGGIAYLAIAAAAFAFPVVPELVELAIVAWFLAIGGYAAFAFAREIGRTHGITRRRMRAVTAGAVLFVVAIVMVFVDALTQGADALFPVLAQASALVAVIAFFLGFAPPALVRRAWREPDLRRFFERSMHLVSVQDERSVVVELQQAAAGAFGAEGASIGIWDPERSVLRYASRDGGWVGHPDDAFIAGRAFQAQARIVALDAAASDPENADAYGRTRARTVIAAPIGTEERRIGSLAVYAQRAPIFIEDDLWLLELLADHTAVLLEARDLARHAGELQAREEAAILKEEFLSAAAHDLRTPLPVVLGQAELLERRIMRDPAASVDLTGVRRIASEARRLRDLIGELLDVQRLEQAGVVADLSKLDLRQVVDAVRARQLDQGVAIEASVPEAPIISSIDRMRIEQVFDNLVENALKYTDGEAPAIRLWNQDGEARFAIVDHGVGIPDAERDRIFERFYRASNAQGITDTGMGLGLYICRRIVEEHGGRIWVEVTPGGGSTFTVALPLQQPDADTRGETRPHIDDTAEPITEPTWNASAGAEAAADA